MAEHAHAYARHTDAPPGEQWRCVVIGCGDPLAPMQPGPDEAAPPDWLLEVDRITQVAADLRLAGLGHVATAAGSPLAGLLLAVADSLDEAAGRGGRGGRRRWDSHPTLRAVVEHAELYVRAVNE